MIGDLVSGGVVEIRRQIIYDIVWPSTVLAQEWHNYRNRLNWNVSFWFLCFCSVIEVVHGIYLHTLAGLLQVYVVPVSPGGFEQRPLIAWRREVNALIAQEKEDGFTSNIFAMKCSLHAETDRDLPRKEILGARSMGGIVSPYGAAAKERVLLQYVI